MGTFPSYGIQYNAGPLSDVAAVSLLIGDPTNVKFTTTQIQQFCAAALVDGPGAEYFLAASMAMRSQAASVGSNLQEVRIGDFMDSSGRNKVSALNAAADAFFQLYIDSPAWAVIEEDSCDFNALVSIRNFVLRTRS